MGAWAGQTPRTPAKRRGGRKRAQPGGAGRLTLLGRVTVRAPARRTPLRGATDVLGPGAGGRQGWSRRRGSQGGPSGLRFSIGQEWAAQRPGEKTVALEAGQSRAPAHALSGGRGPRGLCTTAGQRLRRERRADRGAVAWCVPTTRGAGERVRPSWHCRRDKEAPPRYERASGGGSRDGKALPEMRFGPVAKPWRGRGWAPGPMLGWFRTVFSAARAARLRRAAAPSADWAVEPGRVMQTGRDRAADSEGHGRFKLVCVWGQDSSGWRPLLRGAVCSLASPRLALS
jgi:hypothetical protein